MYIRPVAKLDKKNNKKYTAYELVQSYNTPKGPRQEVTLYLGSSNKLSDLTKEEFKLLAKRIRDILYNRPRPLFGFSPKIEELAEFYADTIIKKNRNSNTVDNHTLAQFTSVDIDSIEHSKVRTIGAEYIILEALKSLSIDRILKGLGFSQKEINITIALITGKLFGNTQECSIHSFLQNQSAIDELLDTNFNKLSLSSLYRVQDKLFNQKEQIESKLYEKEKDLFNFQETILLFDMTNSYFEGKAYTDLAQYGHSKEKRTDCPLVSLALALNQYGFPVKSFIFKGNVSEPKTLSSMIESITMDASIQKCIVFDAGFATKENISYLKEHNYKYIVVSRDRSLKLKDIDYNDSIDLKNYSLKAYIEKQDDESYLYVKSDAKELKETSMMEKFKEKFELFLSNLKSSLSKKNSRKSCNAIMQRLGALKERYSRIARFYTIEVIADKNKVTDIKWLFDKDKDKAQYSFGGTYIQRTNLTDLDAQSIYNTYAMLNDVEQTFRTLKSDFSLRPIYHQRKESIISHLFITTLSYHVVCYIRTKLKSRGINSRWSILVKQLSTLVRSTISFNTKGGPMKVRKTSKPEYTHEKILNALGLSAKILKTVNE